MPSQPSLYVVKNVVSHAAEWRLRLRNKLQSSCADTTDTRTLAAHNPAYQGKFGRAASAYRIQNKTALEQTAKFPFARPF